MKINLSELDRMRFGITIAKISIDAQDDIENIIDWCESEKVEMLIARCSTDAIKIVQSMEKVGFYLTDTLVYFQSTQIVFNDNPVPDGYSWRLGNGDDASSVERLAAKAFRSFSGHYHADPRLDKQSSDLIYSSWASNSCKGGDFSDLMLLICKNTEIVAFLTIKKNDLETCEIILNGVDPLYQKRGLYFSLVSLAKNWAFEKNMKYIIVSTQISNIAPQKVWSRQGFEPIKSYYTFHRWFPK